MILTRSFSRIKAESNPATRILQVMKGLEDQWGGDLTGGGSPVILWNPETSEAWVSAGDWHESDVTRAVFDALEKIPGVKQVDGESESYPEGYHYGQGESAWEKVYPQ